MGKIKKILENELVGGTQNTDIYPITSTKAIYDENNERLDNILNRVELGIIYDVSAHNSGVVFKSLQALLSSPNLSTLIPVTVRRGGMSIRFVQTDNKYVQYRLTNQSWSIDVDDWQEIGFAEFSTGEKVSEVGIDDEPTFDSDNLVKSRGVYNVIEASKSEYLVNEEGFYVIDDNLNVGMKYDEEGLDVAKVSTHFIEVLKAAGIDADGVMTAHAAAVDEDGFFITDESLNIGIKVDNSGIHAKNILEYEIVED